MQFDFSVVLRPPNPTHTVKWTATHAAAINVAYDNAQPLANNGNTTNICWSSHMFYLSANHFEYRLEGVNDTITMQNWYNIDISDDLCDDEYQTIEISWLDKVLKYRRFHWYITSESTPWGMYNLKLLQLKLRQWSSNLKQDKDDAEFLNVKVLVYECCTNQNMNWWWQCVEWKLDLYQQRRLLENDTNNYRNDWILKLNTGFYEE